MKSLQVLQRLAKLAVDQERQALVAIGGEIANVEMGIERLRHSIDRESSASLDFTTSGAMLSAYVRASKARVKDLETRLEALGQAYHIQLQRVRGQRVEEKRYERLAERRAEAAALEAAGKEQKAIDELVAMGKQQNRKSRGRFGLS